jgi:NADH pyrophosphatase NudC (nudix superfamily)
MTAVYRQLNLTRSTVAVSTTTRSVPIDVIFAAVSFRVDRSVRTSRCILKDGDRFLLAVHNNRRPEHFGKWGLVGGRMDLGEDPEATVRREVVEELDVVVTALDLVGDYEYRGWHRVFGTEVQGAVLRVDPREILEIAWHTREQVRSLRERALLHTGFEDQAIDDYLRMLG